MPSRHRSRSLAPRPTIGCACPAPQHEPPAAGGSVPRPRATTSHRVAAGGRRVAPGHARGPRRGRQDPPGDRVRPRFERRELVRRPEPGHRSRLRSRAAFLDTLGVSPAPDVPDCDRLVETLEAAARSCSSSTTASTCVGGRGEIVAGIVQRDRRRARAGDEPAGARGHRRAGARRRAARRSRRSGDAWTSSATADAVRMFCDRADAPARRRRRPRRASSRCAAGSTASRSRSSWPPPACARSPPRRSSSSSRRAGPSPSPGRDHGPAHHLSLDDAIDWSFRLLDDGERALLLVLGTFRGPFDLAAAAAVADGEPIDDGRPRRAARREVTGAERDRSRAVAASGCCETVRAFAGRLASTARRSTPPTAGTAPTSRTEVDALGALRAGAERGRCRGRARGRARRRARGVRLRGGAGRRRHGGPARRRPAPVALDRGRTVGAPGAAGGRPPGIETQPAVTCRCSRARRGARCSSPTCSAPGRWRSGASQIVGRPGAACRGCAGSGRRRRAVRSPRAPTAASPARRSRPNRAIARRESFLLGTAAIYRLAAGDEHVAVEPTRHARSTLAHGIGSRSLRARAAGALAYALQDVDADGGPSGRRGGARDRAAGRLPPQHAAPRARHPRVAGR